LNDLTSQVKKLANPPTSAAVAETQRVMDFVQKNIREPPSSPPRTATPNEHDSANVERVKALLKKQGQALSEQANPKGLRSGFLVRSDKGIANESVKGQKEAASWEAKENARIANFVQASMNKPPHIVQDSDTKQTLAQIKELSQRQEEAAAAQNRLQSAAQQQERFATYLRGALQCESQKKMESDDED